MKKHYISADQLLNDSIELAFQIIESGFRPDLIVGIWRGGAPVGIAIHEIVEFTGFKCDHIAIRTSSYRGIGKRSQVTVHGLDYIAGKLKPADSLLLVDDVFDTGLSMAQVINDLNVIYRGNPPQYRIAVPYFKRPFNQTSRIPDYFLHESADWLVFPHEFADLLDEEVLERKPLAKKQMERLIFFRKKYDNAQKSS